LHSTFQALHRSTQHISQTSVSPSLAMDPYAEIHILHCPKAR
jgi:hypothetical protein